MAETKRRGRPPKTEKTIVNDEAPKKRGPKPKTTEEKKPIRLSEIHEGDLAKLKKEITQEVITKVLKEIVNPLVKVHNRYDKG